MSTKPANSIRRTAPTRGAAKASTSYPSIPRDGTVQWFANRLIDAGAQFGDVRRTLNIRSGDATEALSDSRGLFDLGPDRLAHIDRWLLSHLQSASNQHAASPAIQSTSCTLEPAPASTAAISMPTALASAAASAEPEPETCAGPLPTDELAALLLERADEAGADDAEIQAALGIDRAALETMALGAAVDEPAGLRGRAVDALDAWKNGRSIRKRKKSASAPGRPAAARRPSIAELYAKGWGLSLIPITARGCTWPTSPDRPVDFAKAAGKVPGFYVQGDSLGNGATQGEWRAVDLRVVQPRATIEASVAAGGNIGLALGAAEVRRQAIRQSMDDPIRGSGQGRGAALAAEGLLDGPDVNLRVADIDLPGAFTQALEPIISKFMADTTGSTPVQRHGRPGRLALIYATREPLSKSTDTFRMPGGKSEKVEWLGQGQQAVVAGMHPEGFDYFCTPPLDTIRPEQLPVLTLAQENELREFLRAEMLRLGCMLDAAASKSHSTLGTLAPPITAELAGDINEVRELMAAIHSPDDRHKWVEVLAALKGATSADPAVGLELALDWSHRDSEAEIAETERVWRSITPHTGIAELRRQAGRPSSRAEEAFKVQPAPAKTMDASAMFAASGTAAPSPSAAPAAPNWVVIGDEPDEPPEGQWVLRGLIDEGDLAVVYGAPGSAKTWLAVSMSVHLAAAREWFAHETAASIGVVYVANENSPGVRRRIRAQAQAMGAELAALPLVVTRKPVNMKGEFSKVLGQVQTAHAELTARFAVRHVLLIFDTLARVWGGINDNAAEDMGMVIGHCDALRGLGYTVLLVHHTGKEAGKGPRGHSSLLGAVDVSVLVERGDGGARSYRVEKLREGEDGETRAFELRPVTMKTAAGEPISSAAVADIGQPVVRTKIKMPAGYADEALRSLRECVRQFGQVFDNGKPPPERPKAVTMDQWRKVHFDNLGTLDTAERKRESQGWRRSMHGLAEEGWIARQGDHVWTSR